MTNSTNEEYGELLKAITTNDLDLLRELLEDADIDITKEHLMDYAVECGNIEAVEILYNSIISDSFDTACALGHTDIVKFFVEKQCVITAENINSASRTNNIDLTLYLTEKFIERTPEDILLIEQYLTESQKGIHGFLLSGNKLDMF